ncbi:hypothetical protein FOA52_005477 [Chlamydomonas sp. UWO 241]|nr:hypothetical protein FOA52_005477 [Chlamydomonas sp. UWO 241]
MAAAIAKWVSRSPSQIDSLIIIISASFCCEGRACASSLRTRFLTSRRASGGIACGDVAACTCRRRGGRQR